MTISVELTLTPLQNSYRAPIKSFIKQLRRSDFKVIETPLSTQIYGEYDAVMSFLTETIKTSFQSQDATVLTMKIVKNDRSSYEPNF